MPKVITYAAVKSQITEHDLVVLSGEMYSLEAFRTHNFRTKVFEYAPGTVQFYDKRNGTFRDVEAVTDRTPQKTPPAATEVDEPPVQPRPDFSQPPEGFVPFSWPASDDVPAAAPPADAASNDQSSLVG